MSSSASRIPASATGAAWAVGAIHLDVEFGGKCHQLLFGYDTVGVCVGLIEEVEKAVVGDFVFGQFAVVSFVERHHSGDDGGVAVVF